MNVQHRPPKLIGRLKERRGDAWVLTVPTMVRIDLPDGGLRLESHDKDYILPRSEVVAADWPLLQQGDQMRLASKRGPRQWHRAMTPRRKKPRYRFSISFRSMEVRPLD